MGGGITVYLSAAYLAPLHYYARMLAAEKVFIEQHDHYLKQTYRNRCQIVAANGVISLSIPVDKGDLLKCPMREIRISSHSDWQTLHWRSLVAAYNSSPFFEYYADEFISFFEKPWKYLFDFDIALQEKILSLMEIAPSISFTEDFRSVFGGADLDLRESIHPKKRAEDDSAYRIVPYYQVFEQRFGFVPNMSILDLLFNMGPETPLILHQMIQ